MRLFGQFEALVAAHDRALLQIDRLEGDLIARLGHPRVRLPTPPGAPPLYAAEAYTIARHLPAGALRKRLQRQLRRRRQAWAAAAEGDGLADAGRHETHVARAIQAVGAVLIAQPDASLVGLRLKLVVLLALHAPGDAGDAGDAAEPWRGLHGLLADLAGPITHHDRD